jgi:hypothetical protein
VSSEVRSLRSAFAGKKVYDCQLIAFAKIEQRRALRGAISQSIFRRLKALALARGNLRAAGEIFKVHLALSWMTRTDAHRIGFDLPTEGQRRLVAAGSQAFCQ